MLVVALAGCSGKKAPPTPPPAEVGVVTLTAGKVAMTMSLTGRTSPTLASDVRPQVDGVIRERLFQEGTLVRKGQPLYRIDPRQYQAALDQAAATLANSKAAYVSAKALADRYRALTDIDAVSKQQIDNAVASAGQARATIQQSQAALNAAKVNMDFTWVRAPISGRINRSAVTVGALVAANQTNAITTIQQLDPIFVDIVESADALLALRRSLATGNVLRSSAEVRLKLSDGTNYPQAGRIEFAEATVDPNTGTVTMRARFPNPQGILLPGMFVRVIAPQGTVPNGILAPQQGITRDPKGNATALVVGAGDKVEQRAITTSQPIGDTWLVTGGLKPGDRLIVEGTDKAHAGAVVKPVPFKPAAPQKAG